MTSTAQMEGLWTVSQVAVGEELMTPVAKWFHLLPSGELRSGNGGIVNMRGSWTYDQVTNQIQFFDEQKVADPAGPFEVRKMQEEMQWRRQEEGMLVTVTLTPAEALPKGPWDLVLGAWELEEPSKNEGFDYHSVYFRWDHGLTFRGNEGQQRQFGFWQIHGHRPEMRIILSDEDATQSKWTVHFAENKMWWEGNWQNRPIRLDWARP